jgi:hypothetical protein
MKIWQHSWEEVFEAINQGEQVQSICGLPLLGIDDFRLWAGSVRVAHERGEKIPKHILQDFHQIKGFGIWPKSVDKIKASAKRVEVSGENKDVVASAQTAPEEKTMVLNRKGKPFSWSYTALSAYENCPLAYAEERFYCTSKFIETEAIRDGNRGHQCAEDILNEKVPKDPIYLDKIQPYTTAFLDAKSRGAELLVEHEIALNRQMGRVSWFAKDAWFRGKLDVVLITPMGGGEKQAVIIDWKFGKVRNNEDQLRIFAASLSIVRPDISVFSPKFIFPKQQEIISGTSFTKDELPTVWEGVLHRVKRVEDSWADEVFPAKPSGLCGWCSSKNICEHGR